MFAKNQNTHFYLGGVNRQTFSKGLKRFFRERSLLWSWKYSYICTGFCVVIMKKIVMTKLNSWYTWVNFGVHILKIKKLTPLEKIPLVFNKALTKIQGRVVYSIFCDFIKVPPLWCKLGKNCFLNCDKISKGSASEFL